MTVKPQWSPKPRRGSLRRQAHAQVSDSPTMVLDTDPEIAPSPCGIGYGPIQPWSCPQDHPPRDPAGFTPIGALGNKPADIGPGCGPVPDSSLSWLRSGGNSAHLGTRQETHHLFPPPTPPEAGRPRSA